MSEMKQYIVTEEVVLERGFEFWKKNKSGRTRYYRDSRKEKAIIFVDSRKYGKCIVATTVGLCERLRENGAGFKKELLNPMPCTSAGVEYLHRLLIDVPAGKEADHINGCRAYCVKENIRVCTKRENLHNMKRTVYEVTGYEGNFIFYLFVKADDQEAIKTLLSLNFQMPDMKQGQRLHSIQMTSPPYDTKEEAYRSMRAVNEALYGEYAYKMENDFGHEYGIHLLIQCYFLNNIKESAMYALNREYWKRRCPEESAYIQH